ncbi:MAG: FAD-dependent oxidoreductase [Candidatus Acidiferrales bacterium]
MPIYQVKLKRKEEVAEGTMAFYFEKPAGFQFKPGQFADLTLPNPPETDAEGNIRTFSIASAPAEEDLMFATRMRDTAFKRVLKSMPLGTEITMEGPSGSFTLHGDSSRSAVLLAGGIGITPFRSMALNLGTSRDAHRLLLLYSNRRPEDAAFLDELESVAAKNKNLRFIGTMTQMEKSKLKWTGRTGLIDKKMLSECVRDLKDPICYVAGPPAMVSTIGRALMDAGVSKDSIRSDEFSGY